MKAFRKNQFTQNVKGQTGEMVLGRQKDTKHVGTNRFDERVSPERLPRAGVRMWLEERVAHGPLNGAMR